jgi:hypothetical protein
MAKKIELSRFLDVFYIPEDDDDCPVERGETFCSSRCGCECTRKEFDRAVKGARSIVKRLNKVGVGWKGRVWENCGWQFGADSGSVRVWGDSTLSTFNCMISDHVDGGGGSMLWTSGISATTPEEAVRHAYSAMEDRLKSFFGAVRQAALAIDDQDHVVRMATRILGG